MANDLVKAVLMASLACGATFASAQPKLPHGPTDSELAMLPKACTARLRDGEAAKTYWSQRIGPSNFLHLHHFCFGLNFMNRARFALNKTDKNGDLRGAIAEFDYVLAKWPADSPLRPEAERAKQEAEALLRLP